MAEQIQRPMLCWHDARDNGNLKCSSKQKHSFFQELTALDPKYKKGTVITNWLRAFAQLIACCLFSS
jgi:hypothetical protein